MCAPVQESEQVQFLRRSFGFGPSPGCRPNEAPRRLDSHRVRAHWQQAERTCLFLTLWCGEGYRLSRRRSEAALTALRLTGTSSRMRHSSAGTGTIPLGVISTR